jgi:hypothetical protein
VVVPLGVRRVVRDQILDGVRLLVIRTAEGEGAEVQPLPIVAVEP